MKKRVFLLVNTVIILLLTSCAVFKTEPRSEAEINALVTKLERAEFKFTTDYAIPTGKFQARRLTSIYDVRITPDTIYSHLPYFGEAYIAPYNPTGSPLSFESTNFSYNFSPGTKKGSWYISIQLHDTPQPITYFFTVWDNGSVYLDVSSRARKSISFKGEIEE